MAHLETSSNKELFSVNTKKTSGQLSVFAVLEHLDIWSGFQLWTIDVPWWLTKQMKVKVIVRFTNVITNLCTSYESITNVITKFIIVFLRLLLWWNILYCATLFCFGIWNNRSIGRLTTGCCSRQCGTLNNKYIK